MKRVAFVMMVAAALPSQVAAQKWCEPQTARPYSPNMPGITEVRFASINRTSKSVENDVNSLINTGEKATLEAGRTYEFTITHTRDHVIFPRARNNIRVWIDVNRNGSFSDPGELVIDELYVPTGTSTFQLTVPTVDREIKETRMRITAKMSGEVSHALPTPCDDPADPIGYHGEIEDYIVTIVPAKRVTQ